MTQVMGAPFFEGGGVKHGLKRRGLENAKQLKDQFGGFL
jgi:hypothetical protein